MILAVLSNAHGRPDTRSARSRPTVTKGLTGVQPSGHDNWCVPHQAANSTGSGEGRREPINGISPAELEMLAYATKQPFPEFRALTITPTQVHSLLQFRYHFSFTASKTEKKPLQLVRENGLDQFHESYCRVNARLCGSCLMATKGIGSRLAAQLIAVPAYAQAAVAAILGRGANFARHLPRLRWNGDVQITCISHSGVISCDENEAQI